jgi:hypothetical protein
MKTLDEDKDKIEFYSSKVVQGRNNPQPQTIDFGAGLFNWLKTTNGILVSIGSILASLAVIIPTITSINAPKNNMLAQFSVAANLEEGYTYLYPKNEKTAVLEYEAPDTWTAIPNKTKEADVSRGQINADGHQGFATNQQKPCPNMPTGALVVMNEIEQCLTGGVNNRFNAEPGHKYKFKMNDNYGLYGDNKGVMNIKLIKSSSKGK